MTRMGEAHSPDLAGPGEDVPKQVPVRRLEAIRHQRERWSIDRALRRDGVLGDAEQARIGEAELVPEGKGAGINVGVIDRAACHGTPAA